MQMILKYSKLLSALCIPFLIVSMSSCKKDDSQVKTELFEPSYKDLQFSGGFLDNGIPIKAADWAVEYVKDAVSGEMLQDKAGKPMALDTFGSVELLTGWLKLEKKQADDVLSISLKENFSASPRKFLIGILADGKRDELSFTQIRGEAYEIVEKEIKEIPGSRKEYTTDEGLHAITLTNNSSTAKIIETSDVYKDVHYMSEFTSEDYGAFEWVKGQDPLISMNEVVREGATYWAEKVPYKKGQSLEPYIRKAGRGESVLVQPYTSIKVRGEVTYLERECLYTFTVKNLTSGSRFDISGTWKQKIPLSPHTYFYDLIAN
jgi:hypothetical protein